MYPSNCKKIHESGRVCELFRAGLLEPPNRAPLVIAAAPATFLFFPALAFRLLAGAALLEPVLLDVPEELLIVVRALDHGLVLHLTPLPAAQGAVAFRGARAERAPEQRGGEYNQYEE